MSKKDLEKSKVRVKIVKMINRYAEMSPFFVNPDKIVVKNIISGLVLNNIKHGYLYCPCRKVRNIPDQDRLNICPCKTHKIDIKKNDTCECGLFVNKTYLSKNRKI
jgi:ferredoxin-thioredoxin reductase catalytic subunit